MPEQPFLDGEELMELVRERVSAGKSVRNVPFRGSSMLPMLRQGKDTVELSPLPERLKVHDLPVYQYPSGKYVMHRVVAVEDDNLYICNGDNLVQMERIPKAWMIALVTAFTRDGKRIEVTDPGYLRYCRFWAATRPLRHLWKRGVGLLKRIARRCLR